MMTLLERRWRKSRLQIDHELFKTQRDMVKAKFNSYKSTYYSVKIQNCEGHQRALYQVINHLMDRKTTPVLPSI